MPTCQPVENRTLAFAYRRHQKAKQACGDLRNWRYKNAFYGIMPLGGNLANLAVISSFDQTRTQTFMAPLLVKRGVEKSRSNDCFFSVPPDLGFYQQTLFSFNLKHQAKFPWLEPDMPVLKEKVIALSATSSFYLEVNLSSGGEEAIGLIIKDNVLLQGHKLKAGKNQLFANGYNLPPGQAKLFTVPWWEEVEKRDYNPQWRLLLLSCAGRAHEISIIVGASLFGNYEQLTKDLVS